MVSESKGNTITTKRSEFDWIEIKKGRYIQDGTSHPLRSGNEKLYMRIYGLEYKNKRIYWFDTFGKHSTQHGYHVGFSWWQHNRFLWFQKEHWLQKEESIRYIVNILFLVLGAIIGIKQMV